MRCYEKQSGETITDRMKTMIIQHYAPPEIRRHLLEHDYEGNYLAFRDGLQYRVQNMLDYTRLDAALPT